MSLPSQPRARAVALALSLALVAAAFAAPAASARDVPMARFLVTFEGERTVGWDEPRWSPRYDCQHIYWTESTGDERWQVKAKPQRALLWLTSYGDVNVQVGTWSPYDISDQYAFEANGFVERSRTDRSGFDPNDRCGPATAQVDPPLPNDCGNRLPRQSVVVHIRRGVVEADVTTVSDRNTPAGFRSCALILPPEAPSDWPEQVTGRVKVRDLFNPRKKRIVVQARRGWGNVAELFGGKGRRAESAAVRWKLTLERVPERRGAALGRPLGARQTGGTSLAPSSVPYSLPLQPISSR